MKKNHFKFTNEDGKELDCMTVAQAIINFCKETNTTLEGLSNVFRSDGDALQMLDSISLMIWHCANVDAIYNEKEFNKSREWVAIFIGTCSNQLEAFMKVLLDSISAGFAEKSIEKSGE